MLSMSPVSHSGNGQKEGTHLLKNSFHNSLNMKCKNSSPYLQNIQKYFSKHFANFICAGTCTAETTDRQDFVEGIAQKIHIQF